MKKRGFSCCSFNQPLIREAPEPFSLEIGSLEGSPLGGDFWVFFCPPGWGRFLRVPGHSGVLAELGSRSWSWSSSAPGMGLIFFSCRRVVPFFGTTLAGA